MDSPSVQRKSLARKCDSCRELEAKLCARCGLQPKMSHSSAKYCRACSEKASKPPRFDADTKELVTERIAAGDSAVQIADDIRCSIDLLYRFARYNKLTFAKKLKE